MVNIIFIAILGINLVKANNIISKSFEGETDDGILMCNLCQLHFTSLYNKQSHYSGKLHLQTLLQHLNRLVKEADEKQPSNGCASPCDSQRSPSIPLSKSLFVMAEEFHSEFHSLIAC